MAYPCNKYLCLLIIIIMIYILYLGYSLYQDSFPSNIGLPEHLKEYENGGNYIECNYKQLKLDNKSPIALITINNRSDFTYSVYYGDFIVWASSVILRDNDNHEWYLQLNTNYHPSESPMITLQSGESRDLVLVLNQCTGIRYNGLFDVSLPDTVNYICEWIITISYDKDNEKVSKKLRVKDTGTLKFNN